MLAKTSEMIFSGDMMLCLALDLGEMLWYDLSLMWKVYDQDLC